MSKLTLLALLCLVSWVSCKPKHHQLEGYHFDLYLSDFEKRYESEEHQWRKELFEQNLQEIFRHNADETQTWKKGVNQFTDMTHEEFAVRLGRSRNEAMQLRYENRYLLDNFEPVEKKSIPREWDWRYTGEGLNISKTSPVKDQGNCGSCWAFAATQSIESNYAINENLDTVPILSPQQITSCTPNTLHCGGAGGCDGSIECLGMNYVHLMGLVSEKDMPYLSGNGTTGDCLYDIEKIKPVATVSGYVQLPQNVEGPTLDSLVNRGPNTISVDATNWSAYECGVFDGCSFSENIAINHAVFLVGYDETSLHVKNSWSDAWGEDGYIKLKRTEECGYDDTPADGSMCTGDGQKNMTTCGMCGAISDSSYPINARTWSL